MIAGVILAAGSSARLGRPKQLLELEGRPLLQHTIDAMAGAGLGATVLVLGHRADEVESAVNLPAGFVVCRNPDYETGVGSSLRAGLGKLSPTTHAAAVVLGDQPTLRAWMIRTVVDAFERGSLPIARASYRGAPGHPVVVDRTRWPELSSLEADVGGRTLFEARPDEVAWVEIDHDPLPDIDTEADYESAGGASGH